MDSFFLFPPDPPPAHPVIVNGESLREPLCARRYINDTLFNVHYYYCREEWTGSVTYHFDTIIEAARRCMFILLLDVQHHVGQGSVAMIPIAISDVSMQMTSGYYTTRDNNDVNVN